MTREHPQDRPVSAGTYNKSGCRCDGCTDAVRVYRRQRRAQVAAKARDAAGRCFVASPATVRREQIELAFARGWSRSRIMRELGVSYDEVALTADRMAS